jgi:hypothetical protein
VVRLRCRLAPNLLTSCNLHVRRAMRSFVTSVSGPRSSPDPVSGQASGRAKCKMEDGGATATGPQPQPQPSQPQPQPRARPAASRHQPNPNPKTICKPNLFRFRLCLAGYYTLYGMRQQQKHANGVVQCSVFRVQHCPADLDDA